METKQCVTCKETKTKDQFNKRGYKNYLTSNCKKCLVKKTIDWKNKNLTRFKEYQKQYYKNKQNSLKNKENIV